MGVLTDPKSRAKIASIIDKYANLLSFAAFCGGIYCFIITVSPAYNGGTYFSENALLPGMIDSKFYGQKDALNYYESYKQQVKEMKTDTDVPISWLNEQLESLGLEVHIQDYQFTYPMDLLNNKTASGQNVYGILRASKTASVESIVMTAPLRPSDSGLTSTDGGVGLMLALAKYMRRYTHWGKDIIFLFTQHEFVGMQAWLDGYHQTQLSKHIMAGDLPARSGSIQAAINLEFEKPSFSAVNLRIEGNNGQLPNLDLVNLVTKAVRDKAIVPMLHERSDVRTSDYATMVKYNMKTMFLMMCQQASCMASGNHGLFLRFHIEALTIQTVKGSQFNYNEAGHVVDSIFRSINNLQERFHQSFFFYLLPCTYRYVSIGIYMPPFALLAVGGLIQAIALWTRYTTAVESRNENVKANKDKAFNADGKFTLKALKLLRLPDTVFQGIIRLLPLLIGCQISGILIYYAPQFFGTGDIHQIPATDAVVLGCFALFVSSILLIMTVLQKDEFDELNWEMFKVIALIYHGLTLFALALLNISLATFIALLTVPVYCIIKPRSYKILTLVQALLLILTSPLGIFICSTLTHSFFTDGKLYNAAVNMQDLGSTYASMQTSLVYGMIDNAMFGNWLFNVVSLVLVPNWLMMWAVVWMNL